MKGLMTLDLKMLKGFKWSLVIYLALSVFYLFSDMKDFGLIFSAIFMSTLVMRIMVIQLDGPSSKFLMSLPFGNKEYVQEKFIFSFLITLFFPLLTEAGLMIAGINSFNEAISALVMALMISLLLISIMIPFIIRFGSAAQTFMVLFFLGVFIVTVLLSDLLNPFFVQLNLAAANINHGVLTSACVLITVLAAGASRVLSTYLLEKKQF